MRAWFFMMLIGAALVGCGRKQPPAPPAAPIMNVVRSPGRPVQQPHDGYVTSNSCRDCHERQYETWHRSYHRTMTQLATPESVIAPFKDTKLQQLGLTFMLRQDGDKFRVKLTKADGSGGTRDVVMTTGSHHMQFYWVPTGKTRQLQMLPFAWLKTDERWVPRTAVFLHHPADSISPETGRWNNTCIRCHATHGQPREMGENRMATRVAEFGIACEACHGPGAEHVKDESTASIVHPETLSHERSSQVCGQCHSISFHHDVDGAMEFNANGTPFRPGDDLFKTNHLMRGGKHADHPRTAEVLKQMQVSADSYFWPDGMVRVSGREFNGLVESPCYQRGEMSCLSCHVLHPPRSDQRSLDDWADDQLKPGMRGDRACLQCHEDLADDIAAHTHHPIGSGGSACMNCHMPYTTWGLLKAIRSHTVTSPSVHESVEHGRPNACNLCHVDQTLQWTDQHLQKWYDHEPAKLTDDQEQTPAGVLWMLAGDAVQRSLAAWACGWPEAQQASGTDWMGPYLGRLLVDPYDAVRYNAARSLRKVAQSPIALYDFVGDPEDQQEVSRQFMAHADETTRALIDRLSKQRDDRRVWLLE